MSYYDELAASLAAEGRAAELAASATTGDNSKLWREAMSIFAMKFKAGADAIRGLIDELSDANKEYAELSGKLERAELDAAHLRVMIENWTSDDPISSESRDPAS